jgi:hypothetical protein
MRRIVQAVIVGVSTAALPIPSLAQPAFVNGIVIAGGTTDATGTSGANDGRLGFFSDLYYEPVHRQWWALSDRGPGGGTLDYRTRINRIGLRVDPTTGAIGRFQVEDTILLTDPKGVLAGPGDGFLNGLNPALLNGHPGLLGRSLDPEGLVVDPRNRHFYVADEYGPSIYEFSRKGRLIRAFEVPPNLVPTVSATVDYVAGRDQGLNGGRQDNRGFEGLAISPDGTKLFAVLQDPLINEPGPNNGRNGRVLRIVVYDNDHRSWSYGSSVAQYAYELESQAAVRARILAGGGTASSTDPRQGRNIGLSAIVAVNDREFLVLERDNRGLGVDDPAGASVVGTKRVYRIDLSSATDIAAIPLPADGNLAAAGITPVAKSAVVIDIAANSVLPGGKQAEKWEGLAIGPRLRGGGHVIVVGTDNDYSVTQNADGTQFDVYVDFAGGSVQRDLDRPTRLNGVDVGPPPAGYVLVPGVLHAYRASATDLASYEPPLPRQRGGEPHEDEENDD